MENENKLLKELERIKIFLKNNKILIIIILIFTSVFMNYIYDKQTINKILKGGNLLTNLEPICNNEYSTSSLQVIICYLFGYNILKNITEKYDVELTEKSTRTDKFLYPFKYIVIYTSWIFRAFIFRPIYGAFMLLVVLFAITGSFIFPFLIFGILLYYLIKSLLTKYSNTKLNINKNNKNNNNNI